ARFSDRTTGSVSNFAPNAKIIHIDIDTASISRTVTVDIPIVADAKLAIEKMLPMVTAMERKEWLEKIQNWKTQYPLPKEDRNKQLGPRAILRQLNAIEEDMIVVTDVGQHQMWVTQYLEMRNNRKLIMSCGLGTMGYGFPAAIGAALSTKGKRIFCMTGDGGFQMNMQEMATAVCYQLPITVIIMNNQYLGMVRQMQELFYKQRYSLTRLSGDKPCTYPSDLESSPNYVPDFISWASSYHVKGYRVTTLEEFQNALKESKEVTDRPTVIECIIDPRELVLPMVKSGTSLYDMILEEE
ncbi:MAG: acetolactate synthase large subunit, partial [Firmicutes bacterium]|nr:acetolactate synthase large subunit [Candidatus Scybalomonas excrementavium]